jgi:hypothetical protein
MNHLLAQHLNGRSLSQLEADHTAAIVAAPQAEPVPEDEPFNPASLLARLQAADLAISTGLPLSRQELSWIVGIADTSRIPPTRIRIGRTSLQEMDAACPNVGQPHTGCANALNVPARSRQGFERIRDNRSQYSRQTKIIENFIIS